jgi:superfamily II DNA or RNA helicase
MKFIKRDPGVGYIDSALHVPKGAVNVDSVKGALTFFVQDKMGNSRYLQLYEETDTHLVIPRAFWKIEELWFETVDCRPPSYQEVQIDSHITLDAKNPSRVTQREAVDAILKSKGGLLQLFCGSGKTVVALEVASRMKVPTIVIVDNNNLMKQWQDAIAQHLTVPDGIGQIQERFFDWQKPIVMATYQTLANRAETLPEEVRRWFGLVIFDECHHVSAPTFCRSADLFYGFRLGLTATPERTDGAHVIYNAHVGSVIYKDLKQELRPRFEFIWTGLELNMNNPHTRVAVTDKNGELHLSKLSGYFGRWEERLKKIVKLVQCHEFKGRKTMVLSTSIAELVNLLAIYNGRMDMFSDLYADLPKGIEPIRLAPKARARFELELRRSKNSLYDKNLNASRRQQIKERLIPIIEKKLAQDDAAAKMEKELAQKQKAYLKDLLAMPSNAGLMIARVPTETRMRMLKTKSTIFTIYRYGLEGLDDADLDTVIACEPLTSKNAIQQFTGRILRKGKKPGQKDPLVQVLEDNIGPIIGMCKTFRHVLRQWPQDEGGPYDYELVDHPITARRMQWTPHRIIGQSYSPPSVVSSVTS